MVAAKKHVPIVKKRTFNPSATHRYDHDTLDFTFAMVRWTVGGGQTDQTQNEMLTELVYRHEALPQTSV